MGLPLALAKLLAGEGFSEDARMSAAQCIRKIYESAHVHGPPLAVWAKPIVKPLRAAFMRGARLAAPDSSFINVGNFMITLSTEPHLIPTMASGMPDFVSALKLVGPPAAYASRIIGNLITHPGARAAALREGAVPALVSLLHGKDGAPVPSATPSGGVDAAIAAFTALGNLAATDSRAVLLAADAPSRLRGTLLGPAMAALSFDGQMRMSLANPVPFITAMNMLVACKVRVVQGV